jgi:sugar phosphate isomerase/epimerase
MRIAWRRASAGSGHSNVALLSLAHLTLIDAGPLELIDAAAAGGFDAIGLRIVPPMPTDMIVPVIGDDRMIREIELRLDATGVRIFDIEAVWLVPQIDVIALKPALALGRQFGAESIVVIANDPDLGRMEANLAALCELARAEGLRVLLEPMSYVVVKNWQEAAVILARVAQPNAGLLIDALHFYRSGGKPSELSTLDPKLLPYVHLCDAAAAAPPPEGLRSEGRGGRFYPGEGQLKLGELLRALPADIPIAVEAPCRRYAGLSINERARICGAATRALLSGLCGPARV